MGTCCDGVSYVDTGAYCTRMGNERQEYWQYQERTLLPSATVEWGGLVVAVMVDVIRLAQHERTKRRLFYEDFTDSL